jgi:hypothetical protein
MIFGKTLRKESMKAHSLFLNNQPRLTQRALDWWESARFQTFSAA